MHDGAYFALVLHVPLPQLVTLQVLIFIEDGGCHAKVLTPSYIMVKLFFIFAKQR